MTQSRPAILGLLAGNVMATVMTDHALSQDVVIDPIAFLDRLAPGTEFSFREFDVPIISASGVIVVRDGER